MLLRCWEILRDDYESEQNLLEILEKEHMFDRVTGLQPIALSKN